MASGKHKKYAFRLEIDGIELASFKTAGPLKGTAEGVEDREGGSAEVKKDVGLINYDNITLTRGVSDNDELWLWWKDTKDGGAEHKDLSIIQNDRAGNEVKRWDIEQASIVGFQAADFDAEASENNMEELELQIEGFEKV